MKAVTAIAVFFVLSLALAMSNLSAQDQITAAEYDARVTAATRQRESQANDVVFLAGKLAIAQAEIERLKKDAAACKPEKAEPKKE